MCGNPWAIAGRVAGGVRLQCGAVDHASGGRGRTAIERSNSARNQAAEQPYVTLAPPANLDAARPNGKRDECPHVAKAKRSPRPQHAACSQFATGKRSGNRCTAKIRGKNACASPIVALRSRAARALRRFAAVDRFQRRCVRGRNELLRS
jgi:hypothetical protein